MRRCTACVLLKGKAVATKAKVPAIAYFRTSSAANVGEPPQVQQGGSPCAAADHTPPSDLVRRTGFVIAAPTHIAGPRHTACRPRVTPLAGPASHANLRYVSLVASRQRSKCASVRSRIVYQQPKAIVLDLMNPTRTGRRAIGQ
jgi:hypothetical protein